MIAGISGVTYHPVSWSLMYAAGQGLPVAYAGHEALPCQNERSGVRGPSSDPEQRSRMTFGDLLRNKTVSAVGKAAGFSENLPFESRRPLSERVDLHTGATDPHVAARPSSLLPVETVQAGELISQTGIWQAWRALNGL